jgi:hypothetical protein
MTARIITKIIEVTPDMARVFVDPTNHRNYRPLKSSKMQVYCRAMKNDEWILNGTTLKFDVDGNMIDGQHRCHACMRTGCSFKTLAVYNLPREAEITIDAGIARTFNDHARYNEFDGDYKDSAIAKLVDNPLDMSIGKKYSPKEEMGLVNKYRAGISLVRGATGNNSKKYFPAPALSPMVMVSYYPEHYRALQRFMGILSTGKGAGDGDGAALLLRDVILVEKEKDRQVLFDKTQAALQAFFKRRDMASLHGTKNKILFPVKQDMSGHIVPDR